MSAAVAAATIGAILATTVLAAVMLNNGNSPTRLSSAMTQGNLSEPPIIPKGPPVQFVLYTRSNAPSNINPNNTQKLLEFGFDPARPTKVIIHGFLSSVKEEVFTLVKDAYLQAGDFNVFGMDWSVLCEFEYFTAMRGAQIAGDALGKFLNILESFGARYDDMHLIGHSLGAHVAGIGADGVKNGMVARITGLDPAGPGFSDVSHTLRLDPGDAKLVDAIHTYMRVLSLREPLGHVDFYPNGGRFQPGCPEFFDILKVHQSITCNHGRAYVYFVESILNENAFKCQLCRSVEDAVYARCFEDTDVRMGREETYQYGLYFVKTNSEPPYSKT